MRIISRKHLGMAIASISICAFVYLFYFFPNKNDCFANTNELNSRYLQKYKEYPFSYVMPLIPQNAERIKIHYRINRIKNINISFRLNNAHHKDYIASAKGLLDQNYTLSFQQEKIVGTIYFRGGNDTVFKQINIKMNDNEIEIETF